MKVAGLELGGQKRTSVVVLDIFPKERKAFIDKALVVEEEEGRSVDESLLSFLTQIPLQRLGMDAPLSFPPCVSCRLDVCPGVRQCQEAPVRWMVEASTKALPNPYQLRPLDVLIREDWQKNLSFLFDESFGANRGPRAARASYLLRHLKIPLLEAMPRLALAAVGNWYGFEAREVRLCRDVERGVAQRLSILEKLGSPQAKGIPSLFLYEEDIVLFSENLLLFDALWCALMAFFAELDLLEDSPWESSWGWVAKPKNLRALKELK